MIESVTKADWVVSYIGANVDAFAESSSLGISSVVASGYSTNNTTDSYSVISSNMSKMKSMRNVGMSVSSMYESNTLYTTEERSKLEK